MAVDINKLNNAVDLLESRVFVPHFIKKLASAGIQPQSPAELQEWISLGNDLVAATEQRRNKMAENRVSQLRDVRQQLTGQPVAKQASLGKAASADADLAEAAMVILAAQTAE